MGHLGTWSSGDLGSAGEWLDSAVPAVPSHSQDAQLPRKALSRPEWNFSGRRAELGRAPAFAQRRYKTSIVVDVPRA